MKRVAVVLICVASLLSFLPSFAAEGTPPAASCSAVSPTLPLATSASAPLPSWLAPEGAQPTKTPSTNSIEALVGITPCTIQFCDQCGGSCCATRRGCVCC
jgi:hypothetical protein